MPVFISSCTKDQNLMGLPPRVPLNTSSLRILSKKLNECENGTAGTPMIQIAYSMDSGPSKVFYGRVLGSLVTQKGKLVLKVDFPGQHGHAAENVEVELQSGRTYFYQITFP